MPSFDSGLIIGLLAAIPLSIAANLLTPLIKNVLLTIWIWSNLQSLDQEITKRRKRLDRITRLRDDPGNLHLELLNHIFLALACIGGAMMSMSVIIIFISSSTFDTTPSDGRGTTATIFAV